MTRSFFILCFATLAVSACKFSTANIAEVTMSKDIDENRAPIQRTTSFNKHQSILHCCVRMANIPSDTRVGATWYFLPANEKRQTIDSTELKIDSDVWVDFSLTPMGAGLPYGNYEVALSLDGKFERTIPFTIEPMFQDGLVREAVMASEVASDYFPTTLTEEFPTDIDKVYAVVYIQDAEEGTVVRASWYGKDNDAPVEIINQEYPCEGSGWIAFSLLPNRSLPVGTYSVDLMAKGARQRVTLSFALR